MFILTSDREYNENKQQLCFVISNYYFSDDTINCSELSDGKADCIDDELILDTTRNDKQYDMKR